MANHEQLSDREFPQGWEIYLFRTIPRPRIPKNLKMKVVKVSTGWEVPSLAIFPSTFKIPQNISCLEGRPPAHPRQPSFMVSKFERLMIGTALGNIFDEPLTCLGFDWIVEDPESISLGKRVDSTNTDEGVPISHNLTVSHLGVAYHLPESDKLNKYLTTKLPLSIIPKNLLQDRVLDRLRHDDICGLVEINFSSCQKGEKKSKSTFYYRGHVLHHNDSYWTENLKSYSLPDFDNPGLSVYLKMAQSLRDQLRFEKVCFWSLLNTILRTCNHWLEIHADTDLIPAHLHIEELLAPFIKLVSWVGPVEQLFFKPLIQSLHPEILSMRSELNDRSSWSLDTETWYTYQFFFKKIGQLAQILELLKLDRDVRNLKQFWRDASEINLIEFVFSAESDLINSIRMGLSDPSALIKLSELLRMELECYQELHSAEIEAQKQVAVVKLPSQNRQDLFTQLIEPIFQLGIGRGSEDMITATNQDWVNIKSLSGTFMPANNYSAAFPCRSISICEAVRYKDILVLIASNDTSDIPRGVPVFIVDRVGECQRYDFFLEDAFLPGKTTDDLAFYAEPDTSGLDAKYNSMRDKSHREWSEGKLVWMATQAGNILSISCFDFRPCLRNSGEPPNLNNRLVLGSELGKLEPKFDTHNDLWTVGFGTISFLVYQASSQPILLTCRIHQDQISEPEIIEWKSHLSGPEQERFNLLEFSGSNATSGKACIVAGEDSKSVFVCLLEPNYLKPHNFSGSSAKGLWLLCFRWNSSLRRISFVNKRLLSVALTYENLFAQREQLHPLVAKIVHVDRHDFLLLSVGRRPIVVFTLVRRALIQLTVNKQTSFSLPELPGDKVFLRGLLTNHFAPFSIVQRIDRIGGVTLLDFYSLHFTY